MAFLAGRLGLEKLACLLVLCGFIFNFTLMLVVFVPVCQDEANYAKQLNDLRKSVERLNSSQSFERLYYNPRGTKQDYRADQRFYQGLGSDQQLGRGLHSDKFVNKYEKYDKPLTNNVTMRGDLPSTKHKWPWGMLPGCSKTVIDVKQLPTATVVMLFHGSEKAVHVLHTIHSVLQRTPSRLLDQIILVDDNSKKEEFQEPFERYINEVFGDRIRLVRSRASLGLMRARTLGINFANSPVVVCMDSHVEVQRNWLEPLLEEIRKNKRTLASSYLDWMEQTKDDVWHFKHGASSWKTVFDWNFHVGFQGISAKDQELRKHDVTQPIESPVMIGTVFAISKEWFTNLGGFDSNMQGWGGENIDLPIRVWLCGGRVVNVPCSHVAHLEQSGQRTYRLGWMEKINKNYKRLSEVLFDDYKKYAYYYSEAVSKADPGDLTERLKIREKCERNFSWYLKTVFPELLIPDQESYAFGQIRNEASGRCLSGRLQNTPNLVDCANLKKSNGIFVWNSDGVLRFMLSVVTAVKNALSYSLFCNDYITSLGTGKLSQWLHWKGGLLQLLRTGLCLEAVGQRLLNLTDCDYSKPSQRWQFGNYTVSYDSLFKTPISSNNYTSYESELRTFVNKSTHHIRLRKSN